MLMDIISLVGWCLKSVCYTQSRLFQLHKIIIWSIRSVSVSVSVINWVLVPWLLFLCLSLFVVGTWMHAIIPKIAIGSTSNIETSLSGSGALGCIAEPALVWDLETGCGLIWETVWAVLCKPCTWFWKGRGCFPQKKRMTLTRSSSEPENGLEAFPICKEAHPSCPIQAVILCGLVLSCYTESFSP